MKLLQVTSYLELESLVGYTCKDLGIWEEVVARCLTAGGITKNDSVQVSYGYGLFTGGLGLHGGVYRFTISSSGVPSTSVFLICFA